MVPILSLWLPIIASALGVFVLSAILHMVFRYHYSDFTKLPAENEVMDALRVHNLSPGDYVMPHCASPKDMASEAYLAKCAAGPVAIMTVWQSGPPKMAPSLVQWFLFCIGISVFCAYLTGRALAPGAEYLEVFRFAGTVAAGVYALASIPESIWYKRKWATTLKHLFDGLLFGLLTGGMFGAFWPAAMAL